MKPQPYEPTQEEIAIACAEIQSRWSETDELNRLDRLRKDDNGVDIPVVRFKAQRARCSVAI